ncbi:cardiolipin synthase [Leuconostoc sp. JNUCC 76]
MQKKNISHRFIFSVIKLIFETFMILLIVILLTKYVPYFSVAIIISELIVVAIIISSDQNPEFKIPWLLLVILVPISGMMIYFIFGKRKLSKKYTKRMDEANEQLLQHSEGKTLRRPSEFKIQSLCNLIQKSSGNQLYQNTKLTYFPLGENMWSQLLIDLETAEKFIFVDYFIIETGLFWDSILDILAKKASKGIEVRVMYDDIGSFKTLPNNFTVLMNKHGIEVTPFARFTGDANSDVNNRSHRKMLIIDGQISYTGGINISDEYVNLIDRFGHWKDTAIRINGLATNEFTKMFFVDWYTNNMASTLNIEQYLLAKPVESESFVLPFGDGPSPIYNYRVSKLALIQLLSTSKTRVLITSPYLIIDDELANAFQSAALRGIDVNIITPGIPDKKIIYAMTRANYKRLMSSGVKIYEYTPGFIHSKYYISDDNVAIIGTVNLDYRSLVHHFENGVVLTDKSVLSDMINDFEETRLVSSLVTENKLQQSITHQVVNLVLRAFSPLL